MMLRLGLVSLFVVTGTSDVKADANADKDGPKILAQGTAHGKHGSRVLRSHKEAMAAYGLKEGNAATALIAKMLKVDKIDWDKQMVVLVSGGVQRTGGFSVKVEKLTIADKTLTVHWKLNAPKPGSIVTQALTHPGAIALVDRFEGEVRFDPAPPKGKLER
jgi:hypothetical protein